MFTSFLFRADGVVLFAVPGFVTWCNGRPDLRVLGHEFGHNNGAFHSNRGEREYGNDFSIMGGSGYNMHFTTPGKVSMQWLDETNQVKTVARAGGCFDFSPCLQTCTEGSPCVFDLFAHDQGSYAADRVYSVRVLTNEFKDENIWIEYRKEYPEEYSASEDGVLLVWSIKRNSIVYGPTHLEDFDSVTPSQSDSFLPIGKKWVYDYDNIGAVIEATQKGAESIKVSVYFTDRIAATSDPKQEQLLRGRNDTELGCGTFERNVSLQATEQFKVFQTMIQAETTVSITMAKVDCSKSNGQLPADAGLYVYPTYPLQLELNSDPDMANGALYFLPFECQPENSPKEVTTGNVDVRSLGTPSARPGYHYLDFSQANYFVLHKGSLASSLDVEISLTESTSCYSACEGIDVSSSSSTAIGVVGKYVRSSFVKDPETGVDFPVFTRRVDTDQQLVYDASREAWTLVANGAVFAEQIDKTIQTEYPHVIDSWSAGIRTSCFSRGAVVGNGGDSALSGEMEFAGMIVFSAIVVAVVVSLLSVPYYIIRVKRKRGAPQVQSSSEEDSDGFEPPMPGFGGPAFGRSPQTAVATPKIPEPQFVAEEQPPTPTPAPKRYSIFGPRRERKVQLPFSYGRKQSGSSQQVGLVMPAPLYKQPSGPGGGYQSDSFEEDLDEEQGRARRASSLARYEAFMRDYEHTVQRHHAEDYQDEEEDDPQPWFRPNVSTVRTPPPPHKNAAKPPAARRSNYVPAWDRTEETQKQAPVRSEEARVRPSPRGKCVMNGCANWSFDEGYCRFHLKTSTDF